MLSAKRELELFATLNNSVLTDRERNQARDTIAQAYEPLVRSMVRKFSGYAASAEDLTQEARIGLLHAIRKYDYTRGTRLSTPAMLWIRASINDYVLKNWSLVKIQNYAAVKKIFFNRSRIASYSTLTEAAEGLDIDIKLLETVYPRMIPGYDLSMTHTNPAYEDGTMDFECEYATQAQLNLEDESDQRHIVQTLELALTAVCRTARERRIFTERNLFSPPRMTLEQLSADYGISRERCRQIEERVREKVTKHLTTQYESLEALYDAPL